MAIQARKLLDLTAEFIDRKHNEDAYGDTYGYGRTLDEIAADYQAVLSQDLTRTE